MIRHWSFFKWLSFFCLLLNFLNLCHSYLIIDVPARKTWREVLTSLSYKPEGSAETPSEAFNALEALPSLNVKKLGGAGQMSNVSFRGQTSRNTHLRIDDIPVQDVGGNINFSPLFGGATHLVEVIPGSQGVQYGSGASGGVVLMETPFLVSDNTLTAEGGSFQSGYGHLAHQKTTPHTYWVIHGEGSRTGGLPQYGETRKLGEKGRGRLINIATRFKHQLNEDTSFKFTARSLESHTKYDTYDTYFNLLPKPQGDQTTNLSLLGVGLEKFTETVSHNVKGFLSHNKLKNTHSPSSILLMQGANYTGEYVLSSRLESILLIGFQENRIDSEHLIKRVMFSSYGGWIQKANLTETVSGEVGIRVDRHQKFGINTTYSAILAYAQKNTVLKGSIRTGFLNPSLYSLYITNDFIRGNPQLKPEQTQTVDVTLEHHFPNQHISLQLTPFRTEARKMIHTIFQNGRHFSLNLAGTTKISGIESQIFYAPHKIIKITANHTYTNLDFNQINANPEFPKHKVHFRLEYMPATDWNISPEVLHIGERRSYQGQHLKSYSLANLAVKYQLKPGASIFGRLDNAFDKRYVQTHNYQTPGRAFYVGTHLYF
jgi:vitamin B12 transporter